MPNPKRRASKSRQGERRSHLALKPFRPNHCGRCGSPVKPHRVCDNCGYYGFEKGGEKKGREIVPKEDV